MLYAYTILCNIVNHIQQSIKFSISLHRYNIIYAYTNAYYNLSILFPDGETFGGRQKKKKITLEWNEKKKGRVGDSVTERNRTAGSMAIFAV